MSHIDKLECRVNKQRCWLTLITIVIVAVLAFGIGFAAGRRCGKNCAEMRPNGPPPRMDCGPVNGPACGTMPMNCAPPSPDCRPTGGGGQSNQSINREVRMQVFGGPDQAKGVNCVQGFPMFQGGSQFSGKVIIDRDGEVQTFKIGPSGELENDGDDDNDDNDGDEGDDDAQSLPKPPMPPNQ